MRYAILTALLLVTVPAHACNPDSTAARDAAEVVDGLTSDYRAFAYPYRQYGAEPPAAKANPRRHVITAAEEYYTRISGGCPVRR